MQQRKEKFNYPYLRINERVKDLFNFSINQEEQEQIFGLIVDEMLSEGEKAKLIEIMRKYEKEEGQCIQKFSLVSVVKEDGKLISGQWMQNHIGTIETATAKARSTERANSNQLTIAVVDEYTYSPDYSVRTGLTRLD